MATEPPLFDALADLDHLNEMVEMNEALILGAVRQHELTEAAENLNEQLWKEINQRQEAAVALRESEERFCSLFASAPMAVFACDREAVIQQYNSHAVELWGRRPVCGREKHCGSVRLWLPDGTPLPHDQSPMLAVLRTGVPVRNVEVFIERPDGSRLPVLVNFAPLKDAEGEITGAITSFMDITERHALEAALVDRAAMLARMSSISSCRRPARWTGRTAGWASGSRWSTDS